MNKIASEGREIHKLNLCDAMYSSKFGPTFFLGFRIYTRITFANLKKYK